VNDIGEAIEIGMHYVSRKASSFIDLPNFVPTRSKMQFQQAAETLDKAIYSIISQRRNQGGEGRQDLLSMLMAARDEEDGSGMSDKLVRDQVMTIFLAGHETTANTLSWIWYLLATHPEVEQRFSDELEQVLGERSPVYEDIEKLSYTNLLITEAMRLYPAAWAVNREVVDDVQIGDYTFKSGDTLMMSQYVVHRSPKFYEQPEKFIPERFAGDLLKKLPSFAYFPFGGGPRVCIGNNFALMETALLLAAIGKKYQLRLVPGHHPVQPEPLVTLRPKGGLKMVVTRR